MWHPHDLKSTLINCTTLSIDTSESSICAIISAKNDHFVSLWSWYFFPCQYPGLPRCNAVLNRKGIGVHPFLIPDRKENAFNSSSLSMMFSIDF